MKSQIGRDGSRVGQSARSMIGQLHYNLMDPSAYLIQGQLPVAPAPEPQEKEQKQPWKVVQIGETGQPEVPCYNPSCNFPLRRQNLMSSHCSASSSHSAH